MTTTTASETPKTTASETPNTTPETPNSGLKTRAKSALIMMAVLLTLLYFGGGAYTMLIAAMGGVGAYEWARMVSAGGKLHHKKIVPLSAVLTGIGVMSAGMVTNPVSSLFFLLALYFLIFAFNYAEKGSSLRSLFTGLLYIGFSAAIMIWLRNGPVSNIQGLYNTLTLLFIVWASDISAYFTGKTFGGPKLAPAISPKKTWSGFIGSSVGAGLVSAGMACPWMVAKLGVVTVGGMGITGYFVMGFVLAMFGQVGDLMISVFKRYFNVKDTGSLIPGHGGILDRIDALILVSLIFSSIVKIFG